MKKYAHLCPWDLSERMGAGPNPWEHYAPFGKK